MEDKKIVFLYFQRNEDAIKQTSQKYGSALRKISYGILEDHFTVDECESDTYLAVWNSIPPKDPSAYFFVFLAKIIRHLSIDRYRAAHSGKRQGNIVELTSELEECIPDAGDVTKTAEYRDLGRAVNRYLHTVSPEKQAVFLKRYFYGESLSTIAEEMGFGVSRVKMMLHRLRKELREYLEKEGYDV